MARPKHAESVDLWYDSDRPGHLTAVFHGEKGGRTEFKFTLDLMSAVCALRTLQRTVASLIRKERKELEGYVDYAEDFGNEMRTALKEDA